MKYFAYGSNLNINQMKRRCPDAVEISPAVLSGWKLVERTYADIEESPGDCVNGALYQISENDLAALDRYEGFPDCYTRREVMVADNAGVFRKALVYIMTEDCGKRRDNGKYSDRYRKTCSEGADTWGIPNAFGNNEEAPTTLWQDGVPDIAEGLQKMLNALDSPDPLPRAKRLWCGSRVVVTLKQQNIEGDFGFYPAPIEIATPHAQELSWIFYDLRDMFVQAGVLDSINKFSFYQQLAESASETIERDTAVEATELCRKVVEKAKSIYLEME